MKCLKTAALVIIGLLPLAAVAPADATTVTFDWALTGPATPLGGVPLPGSGTITATTSSNGDLATAITGTIGGTAIAGLSTFGGADNLLFPNTNGTSLLDGNGLPSLLSGERPSNSISSASSPQDSLRPGCRSASAPSR